MNDEQQNQEVKPVPKKGFFTKFSAQFWLVVMFEFFERGSYYGMMSFLSVYFTSTLHFPKEGVGEIKGVIQPLLYFLPILSGAIADRFGYRRVLMVAFALLGGGYFLTSQMTSYTAVFAALVVMGFGAGTFKPLISGTIAKITDESNSTQAFGIYYWSINMGAFLFPLILVPYLKKINPAFVIIASALCTAAMIIPTALFFKDPVKQKIAEEKAAIRKQTSLLQTMANAFEIIYSPIVLLFNVMKKSVAWRTMILILLAVWLLIAGSFYINQSPATEKFPTIGIEKGEQTLRFRVDRNMSEKEPFLLEVDKKNPAFLNLTIYKPQYIDNFNDQLVSALAQYPALQSITRSDIDNYIKQSDKKINLFFKIDASLNTDFSVNKLSDNQVLVILKNPDQYKNYEAELLKTMHSDPLLRGITLKDCQKLSKDSTGRPFFFLFVFTVLALGLFVTAVSFKSSPKAVAEKQSTGLIAAKFLVPAVILAIFLLPGLSWLGKIICSVICFSIMSLFMIDKTDPAKFIDHAKFLLMIILYSGFWILYFQMFDSVLWYVQAYVDASSLNNAVNSVLGLVGIKINWFFDVEHVTVINALTIILLQLVISSIVKNKKAMPTMITGIIFATIGMGILAISTHIWVFMLGITIFSIGEMTAHPKFISYVGLSAPADKKAMYMGYIFLYGVFGSSIGAVVGAKLYVHFVDNLNQPRILWIIFSMIGVLTVVSLLLYNKFLVPKKSTQA